MRITLPILIGLLVVTTVSAFAAYDEGRALPMERGLSSGESWSDTPIRDHGAGLRADTTWYGQFEIIGTEYYALPFFNGPDQGSWNFDRDSGPTGGELFEQPFGGAIENGEGWSVKDVTANTVQYFKVIDSNLDLGLDVDAPIIEGAYSIWVGADKFEADALCWDCGAGYGIDWCQRLVSPPYAYSGTGDVNLSFLYWSKAEPCWDATQVWLKRANSSELLLNQYPPDPGCPSNTAWEGGLFTDSIGHWSWAAGDSMPEYIRTITQAEIDEGEPGPQEIQIIFEFTADSNTSDFDCLYPTIWGPFGADNISVDGGGINEFYDFETGTLEGWQPGFCDPIGDFVDIVDVAAYTILDPCDCDLAGNILEMHAGPAGPDANHPVNQNVHIFSPIVWFGDSSPKTIFMEFDMYADLALVNATLLRPGWRYYPWTCEATGAVGWSPRVGQNAFNYFTDEGIPECNRYRYGGTNLGIAPGTPVPANAVGVVAIIELLSGCENFAIEPCVGLTNATPLMDNFTVGRSEPGVDAPIISFDLGGRFQDVGSYPSNLYDPRAPGPANRVYDEHMDTAPGTDTDQNGDSLTVVGPLPTASDPLSRWEAKLWWRVAKRAPFQADTAAGGVQTRYGLWKERVGGRLGNPDKLDRPDNPQFTWGQMDSVQLGSFVIKRDEFCSYFREDDPAFRGETFDGSSPETEMLWDDIFYPGTRIDYFATANWLHNPNIFYYAPDTSGGFYWEFEILPSLMLANVEDCGGIGLDYCVFQPATLYIDAYNRGSQFYIENALRTLLNGEELCLDEVGCEIPKNRNWDRYDYLDSSSNWNAPFVRGSVVGSNNGMTLNQILGYRAILLNTGTLGAGSAQDEDYLLYADWLNSPDCNANVNRQYFHANGDAMGQALERPGGTNIDDHGLAFLNSILGATIGCVGFNGINLDPGCDPPDSSYCVQWLDLDGAGDFDTMTDIDAYGNFCPNLYSFNVYNENGGRGNRWYSGEDPASGAKEMFWAQVVNEDLTIGNYRTVLDGVSWHHMTRRVNDGDPNLRCPTTVPPIVDGSFSEISQAMNWGFDGNIPGLTNTQILATCQGTWQNIPDDVGDEPISLRINRLYQNQPNPFNPRTLIKFSLAQEGPVELAVYDVNGRLVRTLIDGKAQAGLNAVEWDGTDDAGHRVGSGVYWTQMRVGEFLSNKQMVILK